MTTVAAKPTSLVGKAFWVVRNRPALLVGALRGTILFYWAALWRKCLPPAGVVLGRNVRLQKNRSVVVDVPNASVRLGDDCVIYENARIDALGTGVIDIGAQSVLGDIRIASRFRVKLGKRFLSSWSVFIQDYDPHPVDSDLRGLQVAAMCEGFMPRFGPAPEKPVTPLWQSKGWSFPGEEIVIGDDVWVGANVSILKGARIGNGCIIATGSVVLRGDYPAKSVIAGNPAKVVKTLS